LRPRLRRSTHRCSEGFHRGYALRRRAVKQGASRGDDEGALSLKGIPATAAVETLAAAGAGRDVARIEAPTSREAVPVRVRLSAADRASRERLLSLRVASS
jgi:hypothetical protein